MGQTYPHSRLCEWRQQGKRNAGTCQQHVSQLAERPLERVLTPWMEPNKTFHLLGVEEHPPVLALPLLTAAGLSPVQ